MAGAIDAWVHPQMVPATPEMKGEVSMIARMMQLKCAGYGPSVTPADRLKNTTINIGGTLVLALVWLALVWVWKDRRFAGHVYLMSLAPMTYLVPYLIGLRFTSLKGRSPRARTNVVVCLSAALTALLVVGWLTTKI